MNSKKIALGLVAVTLAVLPAIALAQVGGNPPSAWSPNLQSLGQIIVNQVWIVFTIIAIICFVVAGILFLTSGGQAEKITFHHGLYCISPLLH